MELLDQGWLRSFEALHEGARRGELDERERATYQSERERMARELLRAQQLAVPPEQTARRAVRIACSLPVYLNFHDRIVMAPAIDISVGGLAARVAGPPRLAGEVQVRLAIPGGEPLHARGRMVYAQRRREDDVRMGCQFVNLDGSDVERLEMFVFDNILERLRA